MSSKSDISFEIPLQWLFFIIQFGLFCKFNPTVSFFKLCFLSRYYTLNQSSTFSPSIMCLLLKISRFIWLAVGKTNFSLTFNFLTVKHWLWPRCEPRSWLFIAKYHKSLPVWHLRSPRVHDLLRSSTYICMLYWSGVNGKPLASEDAGFAASRSELLDFF